MSGLFVMASSTHAVVNKNFTHVGNADTHNSVNRIILFIFIIDLPNYVFYSEYPSRIEEVNLLLMQTILSCRILLKLTM